MEELTLDELRIWLGIVIYMGVHSSPAVADYWVNDNLSPVHPIKSYMSQTRFEQIKRYLHISAPDDEEVTPNGRRLWHAKDGGC
jgi:hypothetical protein